MTPKNKILFLGLSLTILITITMGLFDFFKSNESGTFVSEQDFKKNISKQMQMTPMTMEQLRQIDVTEEKELKLEFFFYTNTTEKASQLETELIKLNYTVENRQSASNKKEFIVTGWTIKMKMSDAIVSNWTKEMCEIGYKFDCDFDGWGTSPDQ